jgi:hypothetical protein
MLRLIAFLYTWHTVGKTKKAVNDIRHGNKNGTKYLIRLLIGLIIIGAPHIAASIEAQQDNYLPPKPVNMRYGE